MKNPLLQVVEKVHEPREDQYLLLENVVESFGCCSKPDATSLPDYCAELMAELSKRCPSSQFLLMFSRDEKILEKGTFSQKV